VTFWTLPNGNLVVNGSGQPISCDNCPCGVDCAGCCNCKHFRFRFEDASANVVEFNAKITPTNPGAGDCCCHYELNAVALPGGGTIDFVAERTYDMIVYSFQVTGSVVGDFTISTRVADALKVNCCDQTPEPCGVTGTVNLCMDEQALVACASDNEAVNVTFSVYPDCTQCNSNDPEICLTVFDADYAGGNINWAGQVWTPAEVQAGATKTACPTLYTKTTFAVSPSGYGAVHRWAWSTGGAPDLVIGRSVSVSSFGFLVQRNNSARLFGFGSPYSINFYIDTGFGPPITGTSGGFSAPTPTFTLPNVKGIAFYTWAKGLGWP
jgi:hypothetical protein